MPLMTPKAMLVLDKSQIFHYAFLNKVKSHK